MSNEATAAALAADDTVLPDASTPTPETAPEALSEDDALSAAFDRATGEPEQETDEAPTPQPDEAPEPGAAKEEPEAGEQVAAAPSDLPRGVRDAWGDIPDHARSAIEQSHRELTAKLGDQGRRIQGITPIQDALVEAAKELPQMANMTPQQVAQDVFELARLSEQFKTQPVQALMGYVQQHNLQSEMAAALTGQEAPQEAQRTRQMAQHIANLEKKIESMSDPDYLRSQVNQFTFEAQTVATVDDFSAKAEHWDAVADHMPAAVQFMQAKLGEGASPQDVLSQAYELAVGQFVPDAKAKQVATEEVAAKVDPEKTKAQIRAKGVNVKSTPTGKSKPLSEDEMLEATWEKLHS